MKEEYNAEIDAYTVKPETVLEAVEHLQLFLNVDMWFAIGAEMKTEEDMLEYLRKHFKICKDEIKRMQKTNKKPEDDGLGEDRVFTKEYLEETEGLLAFIIRKLRGR